MSLLELTQKLFGKTTNFTKDEQDFLRKWINHEIEIESLDNSPKEDGK